MLKTFWCAEFEGFKQLGLPPSYKMAAILQYLKDLIRTSPINRHRLILLILVIQLEISFCQPSTTMNPSDDIIEGNPRNPQKGVSPKHVPSNRNSLTENFTVNSIDPEITPGSSDRTNNITSKITMASRAPATLPPFMKTTNNPPVITPHSGVFAHHLPSPTPCTRPVNSCQPLINHTCLGARLPFTHTSIEMVDDSATQEEAFNNLRMWSGLKNVPRCWDVIQPFLCGIYLPRCSHSRVNLPSRELCERTREPCKVVEKIGWPDFLKCDQPHFIRGCESKVAQLRFNTNSGGCESPLVATTNPGSWYRDVDGCGIQCQNPLFTKEEHEQVHQIIATFAAICMIATSFAVLTFIIDWRNANRYPSLILFFINACFFVGSVGWAAQFIPGAREEIVCRKDGTVRTQEPQLGSGESISCAVVFILVYFSMMAGLTWFVILAFSWNLTFRAIGSTNDVLESSKAHFHVVAWSVPLVLTIVCLALTQVDGDSVSGICFVGYMNHYYRAGFVLTPVGVAVVVGVGFLGHGLYTLMQLSQEGPSLISNKALAKIRGTIKRLGIFSALALSFALVTFIVHIYLFINEPSWAKAFEDYIVCQTLAKTKPANEVRPCILKSRPSLVALEIHILAFFGAGITMSSWVWTRATVDAWHRFILRCLRVPITRPMALKKHKIIAQAYNQKKISRTGHISFSVQSSHDDPLGMRFDINSITSNELSSTWARSLPRMMVRRGGFLYPHPISTLRWYSDSDLQSSASHSKGVSRRSSLESNLESGELQDRRTRRKRLKTKKQRSKNRVTPIIFNSIGFSKSHRRRGSDTQRHLDELFSRGSRRNSTMSMDSNVSSLVTKISLDQFASSDTNSTAYFQGPFKKSKRKRRNSHGGQNGSVKSGALNRSESASYSIINSSLPGMIGLTDIEDPSSCFSVDMDPVGPKLLDGFRKLRDGTNSSEQSSRHPSIELKTINYPIPLDLVMNLETGSEDDDVDDVGEETALQKLSTEK